jgi:glycosyltransferase involved in cell wall biosynthesis
MSAPRVVLAHDFIRHGGAERVLEQLHEIWPAAPVYTLLYEANPAYADWDVRSSWLQRWLPPSKYRWPLPLYPRMVERLRFPPGTELIVSSSVSWMKSLRAPAGAAHLCYIHRPMMFAYDRQADFLAGYPAPLRPLLRALAGRIRRWDQATAGRPDLYAANSRYTARRVAELYGREAEVVYPPVAVEPYLDAGCAAQPGEYFLTVSRLERYKRVDLVVAACTALGLPLKVAGRGPDLDALRALAGPTVEFLGYVPDAELPGLMAGCRAFLFSAEEDFGISPVEAQAAGRPVLAFGAGGCLETVIPGVTGEHFAAQEAGCLREALAAFVPERYPAERIRAHAAAFSEVAFRERIRALAASLLDRRRG